MENENGNYHSVYIKKDNNYISLADDAVEFCKKWIKPIHEENWDWTKRDFNNTDNDPDINEARAIRDLLYKDLKKNEESEVDLTSITNREAILTFMNPDGKHEEFNMNEFAYALKVELEHGKIKDANVTNNHPFLTAMIVLAHMSESITYYKRLKIMETEAEIFELKRKISLPKYSNEKSIRQKIIKAEHSLEEAKKALATRIQTMQDFPILDDIDD